MFYKLRSPFLVVALVACGLCAKSALAQIAAPGLEPHVDLSATLPSSTSANAALLYDTSRSVVIVPRFNAARSDKLFDDAPPVEKGWQGLANVLQALTPSADTSLPLTPSQITDRITTMLDNGQNEQALAIIEKRMAQHTASQELGKDVQLLFLHARALAGVGRINEAISVYLDMTTYYPELPEPWNNLAALYIKQGKLDMAYDALQMALTANPNYAMAKANMGQVQLMLAHESFNAAAQAGVGTAGTKAQQTKAILQP